MAEIAAGTKAELIAANNGISVATVHNWAKKAGTATAQPTSIPTEIKRDSSSDDLATLISSKIGEPSNPNPIGAEPIVQPPPEEKLDAKALMAIVTVTKSMVVTNIAMVWRISLTDDQVAKLVDFTEPEKNALNSLAPYAAEYSGALTAYAKPLMAVLFAGVVGMSTARSIKELRGMKAVDVMEPKATKPNKRKAK